MPRDLPQAIGFLIGVWLAIVLLTPIGARGDSGDPVAARGATVAARGATVAARGATVAARGDTARIGLAGDVSGLAALEAELAATVNAWRQSRNLVPLERLSALDDVARAHSTDMATRGFFSHETPEGRNPVDRIEAGGIVDFALAGENVGRTSRAAPNTEIFQGWVASPEHYENLAAPAFNATGVGIARRADGALFYTQVYVTFPR